MFLKFVLDKMFDSKFDSNEFYEYFLIDVLDQAIARYLF